jgi:hypothetical protein
VSLCDVRAAAAVRRAPVLIKCRRCRLMRVPAHDPEVVLCRRCLAEVDELAGEQTGEGPVMGRA